MFSDLAKKCSQNFIPLEKISNQKSFKFSFEKKHWIINV